MSHHLYSGSQSAAAAGYQNAGYAAAGNMNLQPAPGTQYNHVVMMHPVNHPGMPQTVSHATPAYAGYPGRDGAPVMYGGQPAGMMLTAQPMQQGQRTGAVPQVIHCDVSCCIYSIH